MTTPPAAGPAPDAAAVRECGRELQELRDQVRRRIVGLDGVLEEVLIALLAEGHCLLIGVPGLAKTLVISTIAELLDLTFKRIQFTPDLMPNDITGATIISEASENGGETAEDSRSLRFLRGPIFTNLLLADEINRTPPKTQAALMEAMEERQITAGGRRHTLERPFFVLATQNPIEQEGTYPLPVSQLDRFLFTVLVDYPSAEEEFEIMELTTSAYRGDVRQVLDRERLLEIIDLARRIPISERLIGYTTRIVRATRPIIDHAVPEESPRTAADNGDAAAGAPVEPPEERERAPDASGRDFVAEWVAWGGGPRAVQAIIAGARARALIEGRAEVSADDIHRVVKPALRHRIILNYHGEAEGVSADRVIERVLLSMPEGLYRQPAPPGSRRGVVGLLRRLFGG